MVKKYIRGNEERGKEVIAELEKLGAIDSYSYNGTNENVYYFVGKDNEIKMCQVNSSTAEVIEELFKEIKLPEKRKQKLKVIKGDEDRGEEVIKILEDLGGENIMLSGIDGDSYYFIDDEGCIDCLAIDADFFSDYELEILELKPQSFDKGVAKNNEIDIETYLMFVSYVQMHSSYRKTRRDASYIDTEVAPRVYCKDGYSLSVQCHYGAHCAFDDTPIDDIPYPTKIGKEVVSAETDSEDLNQYGINSIDEIQSLIDKHGGIDFAETTNKLIGRERKVANK